MARRGIIGGAADAVKSVAGVALGAAAAAATTAVIESVARSLAKNDKGAPGKALDRALPAIEQAVKARVSKPAQEIADRLLIQERSKETRKKLPARKRAAARKSTAGKSVRRRAVKTKIATPRRKR